MLTYLLNALTGLLIATMAGWACGLTIAPIVLKAWGL